jgi:hypothetical protein
MATVLDLAREVRHRLISKESGCLTIEYNEDRVSLPFCNGTIAVKRALFLSCFIHTPRDFHFKPTAVAGTNAGGLDASVLIEAIEAIDRKSIARAWEPYAEWRIGSRSEPDLHNTFVKDHLAGDAVSLRRLMRLTVSGSVRLEAPRVLLSDEMDQIEQAFERGHWDQVLGTEPDSQSAEIKNAYRRLARRFHPDRWATSGDMKLRDRIERTFQKISRSYTQLQKQQPPLATPQLLVGPKPKKTLWQTLMGKRGDRPLVR